MTGGKVLFSGKVIKSLVFIFAIVSVTLSAQPAAQNSEVTSWEQRARNVTIIRDDWGIPHIYGKTDADTIFGLMYAQAEDDFNRVETNYLNSLGRLAEAEGESALYQDLRMKLFIDPEQLQSLYEKSPDWLKALMNAYADGLNYFLYKNPQVTPRVIRRFEPWMALSFSEGSIGGDIESIDPERLKDFYGDRSAVPALAHEAGGYSEPSGSNGFAIAPSRTAAGHALLLINPHTSFYFRAEAKMVSEEGLNAYGAITWGQFFFYQGFNDRVGWMHTSSSVDNIDEYLETVVKKEGALYYRSGSKDLPLSTRRITVSYKTATGIAAKEFTIYRSHHGPIVYETDGKWVSVRLMEEPLQALIQSYSRTKAGNFKEFRATMELHANSSNNTIYADADGTIAYFHANFVPKRNPRFDWTKPLDGSDPATDWLGVHAIDETPLIINPGNGWVYNTNNSPWSAAGPNSPKRENYPAYVDAGSENARGLHALMVLGGQEKFTMDSLLAAAYDSYLPAFQDLIPPLVKAWDQLPAGQSLKTKLSEPITLLREWDLRWGVHSLPTSLAVYWAEEIGRMAGAAAGNSGVSVEKYIATKAPPQQMLEALATVVDRLQSDFGKWQTPWGAINRYQRLNGDIVQPFNDTAPSFPIGFTSARWGSLASFGARSYPGTKKRYGTTGNSFVAVVEFGARVRARAVMVGGQSGSPASPHFNDQVLRYGSGDLREVYFYRSQLDGHIKMQYHPGLQI